MSKTACPKCREKGEDQAGDNLHIYPDGAYCHKCHYSTREKKPIKRERMSSLSIADVSTYPYGTAPDRCIPPSVAETYGVRYSTSTSSGQPETIYYPYTDSGAIQGYKVRRLPKDFRPSVGKIGKTLFGRDTHVSSHKMLVLTEGEEDCLAAAQMLHGRKCDVMSAPNGASMCGAITDEADLLSKYDRIYICFDGDKAGKKGAIEVADFLSPFVEVRIMDVRSDPSDLLMTGNMPEFLRNIKDAEVYEPDGIINGCDIVLSELLEPLPGGYPVPFKGLQDKLHGVRKGEILTVCAGSGIGKSTLVREITKSLIEQGCSVANIALEDRMEDAAKHLIALDMEIPFHNFKFHPPTESEVKPHYDKMVGNGKTFFYKHFAGITADSLMNKLYYYARSKAVDFIVLDHLSMVISATDTNNERKAIDTLMTNLAKMVVETGVGLIQIVHLRRTSGDKSFAKGGEVELTDLRGSAALEQLSWAVVGLERDQQGDGKDFSVARVLKNRTYGFTGLADKLKYDTVTGRMHSVEPEDITEDEYEESTV